MSHHLSLQVFGSDTEPIMEDWTPFAQGVVFSTGAHGFESLSGNLRINSARARQLMGSMRGKHIVVSSLPDIAWEGRIEDLGMTADGLRFQAMGYWRALSDLPYVSLWSDQELGNWRKGDRVDQYNYFWERWDMDKTGKRLFSSPRKGDKFGNDKTIAAWIYEAPHQGEQEIKEVEFAFDWYFPADWMVQLSSYTEGFGSQNDEYSFTSSGSQSTGTATVTLSTARPIIVLRTFQSTGSNIDDWDMESGQRYSAMSEIRVKGTDSAAIYPDEIAKSLVAYVNAENPGQLNASTMLVQSPNVDVTDAVYLDDKPADILTGLSGLGDDQTPPRSWEVGVWENKTLHFQPLGDGAKDWYIDVDELLIDVTMDRLINEAVAVYKRDDGRVLRTSSTKDDFSQTIHGINRIASAVSKTTDLTAANIFANRIIDEGKELVPSGSFSVSQVNDGYGSKWPLWSVRSGDRVTIRNIMTRGGAIAEKLGRLHISGTRFDVENNSLTITPDYDIARLYSDNTISGDG